MHAPNDAAAETFEHLGAELKRERSEGSRDDIVLEIFERLGDVLRMQLFDQLAEGGWIVLQEFPQLWSYESPELHLPT